MTSSNSGASHGTNNGLAENDEPSVTMQELLEEQEEMEAEANAVLGASDEKNCSYPQGYVSRQALYACATCLPAGENSSKNSDGLAGVCLACSYACHEGHELFELYTKRDFRCDCGNDKFPNMKCSLFPSKEPLNPDNAYNHNFAGRYCHCDRPYPDVERSDPEGMVQCVLCEDWYHLSHIGIVNSEGEEGKTKSGVPEVEDEELVCDQCLAGHPFLKKYHNNITRLSVVKNGGTSSSPNQSADKEKQSKKSETLDVVTTSLEPKETKADSTLATSKDAPVEGSKTDDSVPKSEEKVTDEDSSSKKLETKVNGCTGAFQAEHCEEAGEPIAKRLKLDEAPVDQKEELKSEQKPNELSAEGCTYATLATVAEIKESQKNAGVLWPNGWRRLLCRCFTCMELYSKEKVSFLVKPEDPCSVYEEKGIQRGRETENKKEEVLMTELNKLGHVGKLDILHGYMDLKERLGSFLSQAAQQNKVVTASDIREFFDELNRTKKRAVPSSYVCR